MENKTMMKLVIGTEAIFFLSLIMAFVYLAFVSGYEPAHMQALHVSKTGMYSLMLVASSGTFWLTERNYKKGNIKRTKLFLGSTILLGGLFLFGQANEYISLLHEQITLSSSLFGTAFYTLTGFHGLHVFIGLVIMLILLTMCFLGDFDTPGSTVISTAGMYWHFVDVVWIVVFTVVYLLPRLNLLNQ